MNVMSVCQKSVRSLVLSMEWTSFLLEHLRFHGMALGQLAETSSEGDLGAVVELLVGEEDHEPLEPYLTDGGDDVVVQVGRAIDAVNLGADGRAQRTDVEVHGARCHAPMFAARRKIR